MKCSWDALINLLPIPIRDYVDKHSENNLQEIRLRRNQPIELICEKSTYILPIIATSEYLQFTVNVASKYSPWSAQTIQNGYITAAGGHRLGLCGTFVNSGTTATLKEITSICVRVARDFPGIATGASSLDGSILIIGAPGTGKTTLLRDLIRKKSSQGTNISVVDERQEIFPQHNGSFCYEVGKKTDIMSCCRKSIGIEMVLRSMSPEVIAVDEITAQEDTTALLHAGWCGVSLIASAHASSKEDLYRRPVYQPIIKAQLFDKLIILNRNKTWTVEEMNK